MRTRDKQFNLVNKNTKINKILKNFKIFILQSKIRKKVEKIFKKMLAIIF